MFRYIMCSDGVEESEVFQELVKRVRFLKEERRGGEYMCEIMDEIRDMGRAEGREEQRNVGINTLINSLKKFRISSENIIESVVEQYHISEELARELVK